MQKTGLLVALFCGAVAAQAQPSAPLPPEIGAIDSLMQLGAVLQRCWTPPQKSTKAQHDATVFFSLRQNGTLFAEPTISYAHASLSDEQKASYTASLREAVQKCAPFQFTPRFAAGIAGRPFRIRFTLP